MSEGNTVDVSIRENRLVGILVSRERAPKDYCINSLIASLTNALSIQRTRPLWGQIQIFAYLRDTHNAHTFGAALDTLERSLVPERIVQLWIDEGFCTSKCLQRSIPRGYPQLEGRLLLRTSYESGKLTSLAQRV